MSRNSKYSVNLNENIEDNDHNSDVDVEHHDAMSRPEN